MTTADGNQDPETRRRGPRPRYTRDDVASAAVTIADEGGLDAVTFRAVAARLGTGVMSLYNYVPDKQALVYEMTERVSGELELPEPTGDWRADLHQVARAQRNLVHRHPWLIPATSHRQPLGPHMLALLEWALAVLEPTGLSVRDQLELIALVNGFALNMVQAELANHAAGQPDSGQFAQLPDLLATGRFPRFAALIAAGGEPETFDPAANFDRLLDKLLNGLVGPAPAAPRLPGDRIAARRGLTGSAAINS